MKTFITFLLVLAIVICFLPNDSWGQEKSQEQNSIQKNVQSDKDIGNQQVITSALPINNEIIRISEPPINAPLANRTATVSGNWSDRATWGGSSVPVAGDIVTINSGITVTVDVAAACASITFAAVNANSTITISGTNSLTVSGLVTMPRPATGFSCTINVNAGTASFGSLTMSATTIGRNDVINITTGTLTISGAITTGTTGCQINLTGAGTFNIGGSSNLFLTLPTVSGSTVNYTGTSAQNIYPITYQGNLGLSGAGTKTISNGVYAANTVVVNGSVTNSSTLVLSAGTSSLSTMIIMGGNVTNTGTITSTGAYTRFYFGSANAQTFTNNGTVTSPVASFDLANTNASGLTLTGNGFNVTRANLFYGTVVNSNKITLGTGGVSTAVVQRGVATNTSPAGRFDVAPAFNVGSGGLNLLYDNGSVAYNTGFEVPSSSICNLFYIFDAADVTLNTNLTVSSVLNFVGGTGTPTLRIGANTLTIGGVITYTVAGAFYGGTTSNLVMNGATTVNSILNGLNNFTINANTTLGGAVTVNGTLTLTNRTLTNGANLTMASGSTISRDVGTLGSSPTFAGTVNLIYTGTTGVTTGNEKSTSSGVINNFIVNKSGGVTLASAAQVNGTLFLTNGTLTNGTYLVMANGSTVNRADGTLSLAPAFGTSVNLIYSGTNPITTGVENPVSSSVLNNLTINNTGGITLGSNTTVNGSTTLSGGLLKTTSSYALYFGTTAISPSEDCGAYIEGTAVMNQRSAGINALDFLNCFIHTGANIGDVTVTRVTGTDGIITANGNSGIAANWDIVTTIPLGTGVTKDVTYSWPCDLDNEHPFAPSILAQLYYVNGTALEPVGAGVDVSGSDPRNITVAHSHFSKYTIGSSDAPLPVRLSSFTSSPRGRNVLLDWVTASEINNAGFEIERVKSSELRVKNWEKIGYLQGKGTVNTPTKYTFEDKNLQTGKYQYRLKQTDNNGNFEYFALNGEVEVGVPNKFNLSQNYPNPFNPNTVISFQLPVDSKVSLVIYDIRGKEVKTLLSEVRTAGYYTVPFNGSEFASGIYLYRITVDKYVMTKKMMLVK
ncbi:MAG: T9SS type A sorting domain-containing protein [Ignavibacteriae bacterium]|nr:T9SS type A sorting domain-containing protein [Ignavibacteriota bacterium]